MTVITVSAISLVKIAIQIWGRWYATKISKQIQLNVRRRVFEHAVRLPLHRVQEIRSGGVASILREDGGSVGELMFGMLFNPWQAIIQLIGSLAILAWVDWTLLLGAIVLLPTVYFTHRAWINNIRPQFRVIRKQREQIDASATESFAGMRIVRAFSRQKREAARFTTDNNLMARQELYAWWWMRPIEAVWATLIPIASAGLLFYGGLQVLDGRMTVGDLMMFMVYLLMLLEPLSTLAQSATQFQNSLSGLDRVLDLLGESREMPSTSHSLKADPHSVTGQIALEHVSFTYPGSDRPAQRRQFTRESGPNRRPGWPERRGKNTLSNLVARFYDPTSGRVTLDGRQPARLRRGIVSTTVGHCRARCVFVRRHDCTKHWLCPTQRDCRRNSRSRRGRQCNRIYRSNVGRHANDHWRTWSAAERRPTPAIGHCPSDLGRSQTSDS